MPNQNDSELFTFLVKELIERIANTQEKLASIVTDHEKRISAIEVAQQTEKEIKEDHGLSKDRRWSIYFALSSIIYTLIVLLQVFHVIP